MIAAPIILIIISIIIYAYTGMETRMGSWLIATLVLIIGCLFLFGVGYLTAYEKGQEDAIRGKIHYRLEKQSDSTTVWVPIKTIK